MKKLLIADNSRLLCQLLEDAFQGQFRTLTCCDGQTALTLLEDFRPDALILQLCLPGTDGLTILNAASYRPPVILALSEYISPYVHHQAAQLGIGCILLSPSLASIRSNLQQLLELSSGSQIQVDRHLQALSFLPKMQGYRLLLTALPLMCRDPGMRMGKELYPQVASLTGAHSADAVERDIRSAIQAAWKQRNSDSWQQYFPNAHKCPSNKAFLCRMAQIINSGEL